MSSNGYSSRCALGRTDMLCFGLDFMHSGRQDVHKAQRNVFIHQHPTRAA